MTSPELREPETRGLGFALELLDGVLRGLADASWELRDLAEEVAEDAASLWRDLEDGASSVGRDVQDLSRELSALPARASRLAGSAWLLTQISASYRVQEVLGAFRSQEGAAEALAALHARNARRFYEASVRQGGAFLKVGQLLSARMDLLPEPWVTELSKLQDAVPAVPFEAVRTTIEQDFGKPLSDLFLSFDEEPVAAASIGQVHRATTHDGSVVAVKVKRPGIEELVELDLSLLETAIQSLRSMFPPSDYETIVAEVRTMVRGELDYANEVRMMERVADFFEDHPGIVVPRPVPGLCGERVFASSFVEGRKITLALDEWQHRQAEGDAQAEARIGSLLGLLLESYLRQVLEAGVFQADPHPGNLLVTDAGQLVVLDFGCTRPMPERTRGLYLGLMQAFLAGDLDAMAGLFDELGFATRSGRPDTLHAFADALLQSFRKASEQGAAFVWMTPDEVFAQTAQLLERSEQDPVIRIPSEFVMLGRVFGTLGGLFHHYRPRIDYGRHLFPVLGAALLEVPSEASYPRAASRE
jgi:ubiquinone biosynthesis protein